MPTPTELGIEAAFADGISRLSEDQLYVLMDDYKAMLQVAAQHQDRKAQGWLERRVGLITDAYFAATEMPPLPF